nr:tigger transposable element-derived protein 1-like [Equus asinus]
MLQATYWEPFVVWHSENPRAFKHITVTEMEYCLENGIPLRILLIVDNAPGHPPFIGDHHPNIKGMFLPPHTTSLIQAMDPGVIAASKACCLRRLFAQAVAVTEENSGKTLMQLWKDYNICDCIKNVAWAWGDVTKECMNSIWKKKLRCFIHDFKGFAKNEEVAKINKAVCLRWQTTLIWVWMRMTLRSSSAWFLRN